VVRILLISEQPSDFGLVDRSLQGIADIPSELLSCPPDPAELAAVDLSRITLMIWGRISDVQIAAQLLVTLSQQQRKVPLLVLSDKAQPESGNQQDFGVLPRQSLSAAMLRGALTHYGTKRREATVTISQSVDPLTGLSNRHHTRELLSECLSSHESEGTVALLLIDVDHFKKVNVSYGQGAGDALIQLMAERIKGAILPNHKLARIGGNEFAVIFRRDDGQSVAREAMQCSDEIMLAMGRPFPLARHAVRMAVSMGLTIKDHGFVTADALYSQADIAMRRAKQDRGNALQHYTKDMTHSAEKELKLEAEIRRSLRKEEFVLHFQPRIDMGSGRIVGAEALIRWQHPTQGLLSPAAFIRVAEDSGLIVPLGYWIIDAACRYLTELTAQGYGEVQIAVNVAFKQFQDKNFVQTVANIIKKHGIRPGRLEIELTETTMMIEGNSVDHSLRELNNLGIAISLDDFGTGYSSFAHIQRLPISALKIDRSFVGGVNASYDDSTIVKAMISLAHSLEMQVIAEGAETADQVEFLREHQCDQVQGYFFSRPVSSDDLMVLLHREATTGLIAADNIASFSTH